MEWYHGVVPPPLTQRDRLFSEEDAGPFIKSERDTKDSEAGPFPQDAGYLQGGYALPPGHAPLTQDPSGGGGGGGLIGEDGIGGFGGAVAGTPDHRGPRGRGAPRRRRLRGGEPWRLRLDYLVAYGPQGRGTYCMVCSQALAETKVSGFRRHIQECHPETGSLGRKEREAMAAAWTKEYHGDQVKEGRPRRYGARSALGVLLFISTFK